MATRREILTAGAALGGAAFLGSQSTARAQQQESSVGPPAEPPIDPARTINGDDRLPVWRRDPLPPGEPDVDYTPVVTPNGSALPFHVVDGVKVFHLIAEEVEHEFAPGLKAHCWSYNGQVHGPTIEAVEGDRVRIYVTNRLPAATSVHWHGMVVPSGMDGVGGLSHASIQPGETYRYEFTIHHHGTFQYHSHHDEMTQMAMGMTGLFIVHPREPRAERPDREFAILLHEWRIDAGKARPNPLEMMDFNVLTMNGKVFPATDSLVVQTGERVRIRIGNLSAMSHHPIHLHGHHFWITGTDGGPIPQSARWPESTVVVPVGATRDVEFIADNPGDWGLHCHMTHHVMTQMGHAEPYMIGINPEGLDELLQPLLPGYMTHGHAGMEEHGEHVEHGHMPVPRNSIPMVGKEGPRGYITMGGMTTLVKVRDQIDPDDPQADPGWYQNPEGTEAARATSEELERDGIEA